MLFGVRTKGAIAMAGGGPQRRVTQLAYDASRELGRKVRPYWAQGKWARITMVGLRDSNGKRHEWQPKGSWPTARQAAARLGGE